MEEQTHALADAIHRHNSEIVSLWLGQVHADAGQAGHEVAVELRDAVGDYLDRLAESLQKDANADVGGAEAWKQVARDHALTRLRLGFDIDERVHELIVLRRSIQKVMQDHGVSVDTDLASRLSDLIDAAIAASVRSYTESRDDQCRIQEAEHIGFVTHELRNPLTTATLAASQLQADTALVAGHSQVLALLNRGLERVKDLIEKVLLTEKLGADAVEPHLQDVRMDLLMEEGLRVAREEARRKNITLTTSYDPALTVRLDLDLTVAAVQNLVDNAVKFTDEGTVRVEVEVLEDEIAIHVRDTCSGLSPEELARLFEPFHRGHRGKAGTGLGLAIANRAILAQGGHIEARSSRGEGCHFGLVLPRQRDEAAKWPRS